jgi:hypothetical protein
MPKYSNIIDMDGTKGISSLLKKLTLDYRHITELKTHETRGKCLLSPNYTSLPQRDTHYHMTFLGAKAQFKRHASLKGWITFKPPS